MKIKIWADTNANIHSRYEQTINLDKLIDLEEWKDMSYEEKDEFILQYLFDTSRIVYGYEEI